MIRFIKNLVNSNNLALLWAISPNNLSHTWRWPTRTRWRCPPADRCNRLNSWRLSAPYGHTWQACGTWGDLPPEPEEHIKDSVEDYLYLSYLSVVSCPSEQCRQQRAAWTPAQCQGLCQNGWPWPAPCIARDVNQFIESAFDFIHQPKGSKLLWLPRHVSIKWVPGKEGRQAGDKCNQAANQHATMDDEEVGEDERHKELQHP